MVCLFQALFCIMHIALDMMVFPNSMFTFLFYERVLCSLEKKHLKIAVIIII